MQTGADDQFTFSNPKALTAYDPDSILNDDSDDFSLCNNLNDIKWADPSLQKDLPDLRCKREDWRTISPTADHSLDCKRECALMLSARDEIIIPHSELCLVLKMLWVHGCLI